MTNEREERSSSTRFRAVFKAIFVLTSFLIIIQVFYSMIVPNPTEIQNDVIKSLGIAWHSAIGAMIGLLGGKLI